MKKLIGILILVLGIVVAYQFLTTGRVEFLEPGDLSPAQQELKDLERAFHMAKLRYEEAGKDVEIGGPTAAEDIGAARREMDRVEFELKKLKPLLTREVDRAKVGRILFDIRKFRKESM
jgi:hypothetical protein